MTAIISLADACAFIMGVIITLWLTLLVAAVRELPLLLFMVPATVVVLVAAALCMPSVIA